VADADDTARVTLGEGDCWAEIEVAAAPATPDGASAHGENDTDGRDRVELESVEDEWTS
jgi:hypothetical protein